MNIDDVSKIMKTITDEVTRLDSDHNLQECVCSSCYSSALLNLTLIVQQTLLNFTIGIHSSTPPSIGSTK